MRGIFYYPWFPETWGDGTVHEPSIGRYSSTLGVIQNHVALMEYAKCKVGIASWWGPQSAYSPRMDLCLKAAEGTRFKWCPYYEREGYADPSSTELMADLDYVLAHWASHPNYLRINGKPVIFAYAAGGDGPAMADRWKAANLGRFHVCLKVFDGFRTVKSQPDSWHQYAPANAVQDLRPYTFTVSPGFAMVGQQVRLQRDEDRFRADVAAMEDSGAYWQLITSFNEWGEGHAVEPSVDWGSRYLDILAGRRAP